MAYAKMNPMERIRASVLSGMKLTENDLAGMDPKERQKIEDTIKEKIKEKLTTDKDQAPGTYLDMKA
ncbi:MAG: hypothetical protein INR70_24220 [Parafilimonas terrae]|nr:hypothetical protein [Parafilimonas terrae]